jgi:hypothetical protein
MKSRRYVDLDLDGNLNRNATVDRPELLFVERGDSAVRDRFCRSQRPRWRSS